jgi:hypothetical protein
MLGGPGGGPEPLLVVFLRSQHAFVTGDTSPPAGSYDMNATFTSLEQHERGIHVV